jgi:hypothetical protein
MPKVPKLPQLLDRKIYKTGQTRGADDDVIFQNRVARNSTVLIPLNQFENSKTAPDNKGIFENGFIVLVKPEEFFEDKKTNDLLTANNLKLGKNALLFYETREQWERFNPDKKKLKVATSRKKPLKGTYVARVPATTSENGSKILRGYTTTNLKGAGIRVYEYASQNIIRLCKIQLRFLFWSCVDAIEILRSQGMSDDDITQRKATDLKEAKDNKLDDNEKLRQARIINAQNITICPLCLEQLSADGFFNRLEQAEGRDVPDLTVTQLNLFHVRELRSGEFNHKPYNLGWGHHHCNIVTKDSGISDTLTWMKKILDTNRNAGFEF